MTRTNHKSDDALFVGIIFLVVWLVVILIAWIIRACVVNTATDIKSKQEISGSIIQENVK